MLNVVFRSKNIIKSMRNVPYPSKPKAINDYQKMPKYYCKIRYVKGRFDGTQANKYDHPHVDKPYTQQIMYNTINPQLDVLGSIFNKQNSIAMVLTALFIFSWIYRKNRYNDEKIIYQRGSPFQGKSSSQCFVWNQPYQSIVD